MSEKTPASRLTRIGARMLRVGLVLFALMLLGGSALGAEELQFNFGQGTRASIYSADYVLEHWVSRDGEAAWLEIPGYGKVELLLPREAGGNCEIDRFHPHQPSHVADALAAVSHPAPVEQLSIYILPYPRAGLTSSSAVDHRIFLSPGVHPVAEEVTHMVTTHELGHVFHNTHMPDEDRAIWDDYRGLRGIEDTTVFCESAQHRNRPHEILAEDFRYLFGGDLANYSHSIENSALALPTAVTGLYDFLFTLGRELAVSKPTPALAASNYPNPFNPTTRISLNASAEQIGEAVCVQIFDAQGRSVRTLHRGVLDSTALQLEWNGADDRGRAVPSGIYFSRIRVGQQQLSHKMLLIG